MTTRETSLRESDHPGIVFPGNVLSGGNDYPGNDFPGKNHPGGAGSNHPGNDRIPVRESKIEGFKIYAICARLAVTIS